jgi:hypothetical protein
MTAIFLSRSDRNQAVIGDVGRKKNRKTPHPIVSGPNMRKIICNEQAVSGLRESSMTNTNLPSSVFAVR